MAKKIKFPFQNTALANLPGEKWKDIYRYEGYYKISNHGRVKALQRKVIDENGRVYHYREKMRKSKLHVNHNKTVGQPTYKLFIGLTRENKTYHFSVARLVYHAFVKPFDLDDHHILITHNDFEGRNNYASNLEMSDSGSKMIRSYNAGRATGKPQKPVTQFDQNGKRIGHYSSIMDAAQKTGFGNRGISNAAHGKYTSSKAASGGLGSKPRK